MSLVIFCIFLTGCATTVRKSASFDQSVPQIKTIAVMPPDVEVYKITAGGIREMIDEWTATSKVLIEDNLKEYLAQQYGFSMAFIKEETLKEHDEPLWIRTRGLYEAVAISAIKHAFSGIEKFHDKTKNFDYTLGPQIEDLVKFTKADALLFVYAYDHEATFGRKALWWWNLPLSLYTGINLLPGNPSLMVLGLVDGKTGDLIWFKISNPRSEYSFTNPKDMEKLVQWMTRDFMVQK